MLKDGTDVRLDSAFQVVIKHHHLVDDQIQVPAFQLAFFQDVLEHIDGGFDHLVDLDDEVSLVRQQVNLVGRSVDFLLQSCAGLPWVSCSSCSWAGHFIISRIRWRLAAFSAFRRSPRTAVGWPAD